MVNLIPVSELIASSNPLPETIACSICQEHFSSEMSRAQHLDRAHPGWAATMMFNFLRRIPRENG